MIDDCYNANPVSMKASLEVLSTADTRTVAILGDMFELGEKENELHAECGKYAVEKGIDVLICIGTLSKHTAEGGREACAKNTLTKVPHTDIHYFPSKAVFFTEAQKILKKGDTVLIKASHGMEFPEIVEYLKKSILV